MARIKVQLSPEELERVRYDWQHHKHAVVRRRLHIVWLRHMGHKVDAIIKVLDCCRRTVQKAFALFAKKGLEALYDYEPHGPSSNLDPFIDVLKKHFAENPVRTSAEAAIVVERITGIKKSPSALRTWLKKIGLKPLKVGSLPAKADPAAQREFLETELQPRLEEAEEGSRAVLFVDGCHMLYAPFLGVLWCLTRQWVRTPPGRRRYNVLGAVDPITQKLISIRKEGTIKADTVMELLELVALEYAGQVVTLVLDNARYQHCAAVKARAKELGIELLFLPPYSPNLNLIERLWKLLKKHALSSRYHEDFNVFRDAIDEFMVNPPVEKMESLLTLNFQMFDEMHSVAV